MNKITNKKERLPSAMVEVETIVQKTEGALEVEKDELILDHPKESLLLATKGVSLLSAPKPSDHPW